MGPALRTVYLRRSGGRKGFNNYQYNMRTATFRWTKQKLWEFLEDPEKMFPETSMSFDGVFQYR